MQWDSGSLFGGALIEAEKLSKGQSLPLNILYVWVNTVAQLWWRSFLAIINVLWTRIQWGVNMFFTTDETYRSNVSTTWKILSDVIFQFLDWIVHRDVVPVYINGYTLVLRCEWSGWLPLGPNCDKNVCAHNALRHMRWKCLIYVWMIYFNVLFQIADLP